MATYTFSSLSNGLHLDFDPEVDTLIFDSIDIAASAVRITSSGGNLSLSFGGKTVWLDAMSVAQIAVLPEANIRFADGSSIGTGDGTTGMLTDWYGQNIDFTTETVGSQLWGLGGADLVQAGSAADWIVGNTALSALDHVSRSGSIGSPTSSEHASISADGRFVAFDGGWSGFGSPVDKADVLVKDMTTGAFSSEHRSASGTFGNSGAGASVISADASRVAFVSASNNLVAGPVSNSLYDIYVADAQGSGISRANTGSGGQLAADGASVDPDLSRDARYVVFESDTSNWASGGAQSQGDIYLKDLVSGSLKRISTSLSGGAGNGESQAASVSADGRFVVFQSDASNLTAGDSNGHTDIFVWDRSTGSLQNLSDKMQRPSSAPADGDSAAPDVVSDGEYGQVIVFQTDKSLTPLDTAGNHDIYVYSMDTQSFERVSTTASGSGVTGDSRDASVSGDGRFVVFTSDSNSLVADDSNSGPDVFVKDLYTGAIALVSKAANGGAANGPSGHAEMSLGGDWIVFESSASNLAGSDANGSFSDVFRVSNPLLKDTLIGGAGNDTYVIARADNIVEAAGGGTDTVRSSISHTLGANVENLLIDSGSAVNATGNTLNNVVFAGAGNNVINGGSGTDAASYQYASAAVSLNLTITTAQATGGSASDTLLGIENLTGSNYDDRLTGNASANVLNGGSGNDTLTGSDGSDSYYVGNTGDVVVESNASASTGGTDTVRSSVSYTLGVNLEKLMLNASGAINGSGNTLNNVIYAGAGNNVMNGGSGTDTASYQYATAAVTVNLAITAAQATGGSASDTLLGCENLAGSDHNDRLLGNASANVLTGGAGNDTLTGAAGADNFMFASALNASSNKDVLTDFATGSDRLTFDDAVFAGIGPVGALASGAFYLGTSAHDSSDRVIYDKTSGNLYYDADGNGAGAKILFANLTAGTTLASADLWVG